MSQTRVSAVATGSALGAEVIGVDLRDVDDDTFGAIHSAWLHHLVLLFRGQILSDDQLIAFNRRLGELDLAPIQETGRRFVEGYPEIYIVSNVIEKGAPIGSLGAGELRIPRCGFILTIPTPTMRLASGRASRL
jgi:taurine dioxygenase